MRSIGVASLAAVLVLVSMPARAQAPHTDLGPIFLARDDLRPVVVRRVLPEFPDRPTIREVIDVEAVVGREGTVLHARVAGARPERAARERAAVEAVGRWLFRPAIRPGSPMATVTLVIVRLTSEPAPTEGAPVTAEVVLPPAQPLSPQDAADPPATVYPINTKGLRSPSTLRRVQPHYAAAAMRAKVQGTVQLDIVILADGTVGAAKVMRSLGADLDNEALAAARYWLFEPGTLAGQPVASQAILELEFRVR